MKTQTVRLLDVFVFGPFLLYAGTRPNLSRAEKSFLLVIGAGTVIYNMVNYLAERERSGNA